MRRGLIIFVLVSFFLILLLGIEILELATLVPVFGITNVWQTTPPFSPLYSPVVNPQQFYSSYDSSTLEHPLNVTTSSYRTEYNLSTSLIQPYDLTADGSNNIWFTDYNQPSIYKLDTTSNTYTNYSLPKKINPFTIVYGGKNILWMTDFNFTDTMEQIRDIVRYNVTSGNTTLYTIPTVDPGPFDIAIQNSTTLWFTEWYGRKIARLDLLPQPNITEYTIPCANIDWCGPLGIALDAQNNVWYVNTYSSILIKFDPKDQQQTQYLIPNNFLSPVGINIDTQGNIWTGEHVGNRIVKFNPTNDTFSFYAVPTLGPFALGLGIEELSFDATGNIWFNEHFTNRIGRFNPQSNTVMQYMLPGQIPLIQNIYVSKINNQVWYAEWGTNSIGMININQTPSLTVKTSTPKISLLSGTAKLVTVDVSVQLDTAQPLSILPLTQNTSGIQMYVQPFNSTLNQNQSYSFPVILNITNTVPNGMYYLPIGVQGSNYTASTTLVLQIQPNKSITGFSFIYFIGLMPLLALIEQRKRKKK